MQYQVVQTDQTAENGQKPHFWLFGSFKNPFLRFLNDHLWTGNLAEHWWTFSFIKICNIKSIGQAKVKKRAKNLIFGYLDHSKRQFLWFLTDPTLVIGWATHAHHLVLWKYAISNQSDAPNSRKWPKTSFLAIWIIQKGIFQIFEWSSMSYMMTKSCTPFSSIEICNIESIWCSKLEKIAENHMDHSKRPERVYASHGKFFLKWTRFFPDMQSSQKGSRHFVLNCYNVSAKSLHVFLSNIQSKSKRGHFWHVLIIIEWSRFFLRNPAL